MSKNAHSLIRSLLGSPIAFHKVYLHITKSAAAAIMLSQMVYWQGRPTPGQDDWFYKTQEEWFDETALSDESQVTARRQLCKLGVLEEKRRGPRRQLWFKVNMQKLILLVQEWNDLDAIRQAKRVSENLGVSSKTSIREPRGLESGDAGVESPGMPDSLLTKNTTETTSYIIPVAPQPEVMKPTRHAEFKNLIKEYWDSKNDIGMPWDGSDARALTVFEKANPGLSAAGLTRLLIHRSESEVNHSERPRAFISILTNYARGPLNFYKTPKSANGVSQKQAEHEVKVNDNIRNSITAREQYLGKERSEVRPGGPVSGQVRPVLESPTDIAGVDRRLVRGT